MLEFGPNKGTLFIEARRVNVPIFPMPDARVNLQLLVFKLIVRAGKQGSIEQGELFGNNQV